MQRRHLTLATAVCAAALLGGCSTSAPTGEAGSANKPPGAEPVLAGGAESPQLIGDRLILERLMLPEVPPGADNEKPAVDQHATRDLKSTAGQVYRKGAPAVVIVRTKSGHGTGSLISADGLVLTNRHVIEKALSEGSVDVYLGSLMQIGADKVKMEFDDRRLPADILAASKAKDLALLKIRGARTDYPHVTFAAGEVEPTDPCIAIGHPRMGLLWTVRESKVAGIGNWPMDGVNMLGKRVGANEQERAQLQKTLAQGEQMKIVLSNCGINRGDSGGPLFNALGEMIAVTFAMPDEPGTTGFAYHIHLHEVKDFLARNKSSKTPVPAEFDPWPAGAYLELIDIDGDGVREALGVSATKDSMVTGLLLDLKQQNKIKSVAALANDPRQWKFDVALHFKPAATAYYDPARKGSYDVVIAKDSGGVQVLRDGKWQDAPHRPILDPDRLTDQASKDRLAKIAKVLRK